LAGQISFFSSSGSPLSAFRLDFVPCPHFPHNFWSTSRAEGVSDRVEVVIEEVGVDVAEFWH